VLVVEHDACPEIAKPEFTNVEGTLLGEKPIGSGLAALPVRCERVAQDVQRNRQQHEVFRQKLPDIG
jgi:hypothetical protein